MKQIIKMSFDLYKRRFASIIAVYALALVINYGASTVWFLSVPASWLVGGILAVYFVYEAQGSPKTVNEAIEIGKRGFARLLGANALITLYCLLWALIPIAGAFIAISKYYSYCFAPNIAYDRPNLPLSECLKQSERLARGRRREMFTADLVIMGLPAILLAVALILFYVVILYGATVISLLALIIILPALGGIFLLGPLQCLVRARYFIDCEMLDGYGGSDTPFIVYENPVEDEAAPEESFDKKQET